MWIPRGTKAMNLSHGKFDTIERESCHAKVHNPRRRMNGSHSRIRKGANHASPYAPGDVSAGQTALASVIAELIDANRT
jgi:hypothetical protein